MRLHCFLALSIFILTTTGISAQDHGEEAEDGYSTAAHPKRHHYKHSIQFFNGMTIVPGSAEQEDLEDQGINFVSTIGFNYGYAVSHHFGLRLMTDIELAKYFISSEGDPLLRSNVLIFALTAVFNPVGNLELFVGPGYEIESHENMWLARLGAEYPLYVANGWYLGPEMMFDLKEKYHSIAFGVKIVKAFD